MEKEISDGTKFPGKYSYPFIYKVNVQPETWYLKLRFLNSFIEIVK